MSTLFTQCKKAIQLVDLANKSQKIIMDPLESASGSDFVGFSEEETGALSGFSEETDEVATILKQAPKKVKSGNANILNFVIIPEGDESEVDDLDLSDDEDEVNQIQTSLPLPDNIEVFDYASEGDESGTDQEEVQPSPPKKVALTRSKRHKKNNSPPKTRKCQQKQSVRKWSENGHESVDPPSCDSNFPAPPKKPMTPYQYFSLFLDKDIINNITSETNKYAQQKTGEDKLITSGEIEQYLGILLLTGIVKTPSFRMYWAAETRYAPIADVMSRNRFEEIKRFIHFNDNSSMKHRGEPGYDKLFKMRPFVDAVRANFLKIEPEPEQSIDEIMVPTKARCSIRQYNPNKPHKFGIKITGRAGKSGFLYDFEVYEGKSHVDASGTWGVSGDIVLRLVSSLEPQKHFRVFADNWFSSYAVVNELQHRGFEYTGTIRRNRIPKVVLKSDEQLKKGGRGSHDSRTSDDGIKIVKWMDNKIIHLISTYGDIQPVDLVKRWSAKDKKFIYIERPAVVKDYNQAMGGIDLNDQLVAIYRTDIGTKKYYLRLFHHLLDVCVVNAWLLYRRHCTQRAEGTHMTLLNFRVEVANSLIKYGKHILQRRGRPTKAALAAQEKKSKVVLTEPTLDVRFDGVSHWPETTDRQRCRQCNHRNHFTYFKCSKCNIPLCLTRERNCFSTYHLFPT